MLLKCCQNDVETNLYNKQIKIILELVANLSYGIQRAISYLPKCYEFVWGQISRRRVEGMFINISIVI